MRTNGLLRQSLEIILSCNIEWTCKGKYRCPSLGTKCWTEEPRVGLDRLGLVIGL